MKTSKHYPIGQVCTQVALPHSTIRFWEKTFAGLRSLRSSGGHRYYSAQQVELIRLIKKLLHEDGLTIEGAKKYIANNRESAFAELAEITSELAALPESTILPAQPTEAAIDENLRTHIKTELKAILELLR
jgi:DNA-binding transcriptional MerR regulator